ncbi:MAG: hypothetical protein QOJ50_1377 [Cryptosporangiaceae bacterium]|nr:hypothetical protein [Cryptosporangiaceae bacterium]
MRVLAARTGRCAVNFAAAAAIMLPAAAAHAAVTPAAGNQALGSSANTRQAIEAYWTPARMRAAKPAEQSPEYKAATQKALADRRAGRAIAAPHWGKPFSYPHAEPTRRVTPGATTDPNLPSTHPTAATMGKVFYVSNGADYACSGTVVNTPGHDSVWTAAHCLHTGKGGGPVSNWAFAPAYDSDLADPEPYGLWTAATLFPANGWVFNSDMAEDMGVAIMRTNASGTHIAQQVGGQGLTANSLLNVTENAFGYPEERPYTGGHLIQCSGLTASQYPVWAQTVTIPCTMTGGSSGGGWLLNYDGRYGSLNGINSWINGHFFPTLMASPYFDQTALDLFTATKNL